MAQRKVDFVREIYERWGQGDFAAGIERYDPNVLLVLRPEFPDSGTYLGLEEIGKYMRGQFLADLHDAEIAGEEFIEAGDSVVVAVNQEGTGPGSGVRVPLRYFQVWTFRGDAVIRIESIRERDDALAEVGLLP
jgi:ketosteroid isomerase-like protein